ncbi:MAG: peptidase MA family metallohydrolase, partial [Chloroflexota bacterium]
RHRVADERFECQIPEGDGVNVWRHRGSESFARRALRIAEEAVDSAAELLGVEDVEPVDFIIYSDRRAFRQAMGPSTRENVGGQAHPEIRTLFGLIEPRQIDSDWVEELVVHELSHLVFDEAVRNPYAYPPRWLNEGLAVYLSSGYTAGDRAQVEGAAGAGSIIPLDGLSGQFPTRPRRFGLAYAESVSAVDYFVETYGEERLVELIRSFAEGTGLDEGFRAATGKGFASFDDAWLASLGVERPEPLGPQVAPAGDVPDAWDSPSGPLLRSRR